MKVVEVHCNCPDCRSHTLADCINNRCDCCDLEDAFVVISKQQVPHILLA
jgi:hypothetical protein